MDTITALQYIGLSEKEAKVYTTLLGLGRASAYLIAEKSGLKKPTTYVLLSELVEKGVVSRVPRVRKQIFQAKAPEDLMSEAETRLEQAKLKLPELKALVKGNKTKARVYFLEGLNGLKQTLVYGLKKSANKEIVGFFATTTNAIMERFDGFKEFNEALKANTISLRGLAPDDKILSGFRETDKEFGRTFKVIDSKEYSPLVSIEMGEDFVKIHDFENLQAIIIENESITKTLKQIFELIWKKS